jgi:uncharacterized protein
MCWQASVERVSVFLSGLLFGAGVTLSGMVNPAKVLNFLDVAGAFDPTLAIVMASGLGVTLIGYRLILRRPRPLFANQFPLPGMTGIDRSLLGGSALFGIGWGMAGFCPGPAIASLVFGYPQSFMFVAAMAAGMMAVKLLRYAVTGGQPAS